MAAIIRMSSKAFFKDFIKKYDYKKYNFLLISEDIKTIKKYNNVYDLKSLIPPSSIIAEYINNGLSDKYMRKYIDFLSIPKNELMITIMVKLAVIDNSNVVLLCSEDENEYKYTEIICQYIEEIYGLKTYSFKKYDKNPKKCEKIENKKKIANKVNKKIKHTDFDKGKYTNRGKLKSKLNKLSKKDLKNLCKQNSIQIYPDYSKEDMIKEIMAAY